MKIFLCVHSDSDMHRKEYDRRDSFPLNNEPNGIPFGSHTENGNCHYDHNPCNMKGIRNVRRFGCREFLGGLKEEMTLRDAILLRL